MIESETLFIRPYSEEDFEVFIGLMKEDPILGKFDEAILRSSAHDTANSRADDEYSIIEKVSGDYCGYISLMNSAENEYPEVGITLLESKQNRGIGSEALRLFFEYCRDKLKIDTLLVRIDPENARSIHVFEKLGAEFIGKKNLPIIEKLYKEMGECPPDDLDASGANTYYLKLK